MSEYVYRVKSGYSLTDVLSRVCELHKNNIDMEFLDRIDKASQKFNSCIKILNSDRSIECYCIINNTLEKRDCNHVQIKVYKHNDKYYLIYFSIDDVLVGRIVGNTLITIQNWRESDILTWAAGSTSDFAKAINLHASKFSENAISGEILLTLDEKDFKDIGVLAFGYRRSMTNMIANIKEELNLLKISSLNFNVSSKFIDLFGKIIRSLNIPEITEEFEKANLTPILFLKNSKVLDHIRPLIPILEQGFVDKNYSKMFSQMETRLSDQRYFSNVVDPDVTKLLQLVSKFCLLSRSQDFVSNVMTNVQVPLPCYVEPFVEEVVIPYEITKKIVISTFTQIKNIINLIKGIWRDVEVRQYFDWIEQMFNVERSINSCKTRITKSKEELITYINKVRSLDGVLFFLTTNNVDKSRENPEPSCARKIRKKIKKEISHQTECGKLLLECFLLANDTSDFIRNRIQNRMIGPISMSAHENLLTINLREPGMLTCTIDIQKFITPIVSGKMILYKVLESGQRISEELATYESSQTQILLKMYIVSKTEYYTVSVEDIIIVKIMVSIA